MPAVFWDPQKHYCRIANTAVSIAAALFNSPLSIQMGGKLL